MNQTTGIEKHIKTGMPGLDTLLKGGFLKNSAVTVSGGPGSGKTTFALQFLIEGIKNNENVMYISFNLRKTEVFHQIIQFNYGVDFDTIKQKMIIIEYPPEEIEELMKKRGAISEMIKTTNITRVVIDPVTSFVYIQSDSGIRRKYLYSIVDNFKQWGVTSVIIDNDDKYEPLEIPRTMTGIEGFTDGYIHFSYLLNLNKMQRRRGIEIIKMRGAPDDIKIHDIEITPKGISITDKKVTK